MIRTLTFVLLFASLTLSSKAFAGVVTALVRESDSSLGQTITAINNSAVNHTGGYAFSLTFDGSTSAIVGNNSNGSPSVLRTEATIGDQMQTSFEGFFGISDAGQLAYSPGVTNTTTNQSGIDAVWVDDSPVLSELDPVIASNGSFSSFNSRPAITSSGIPYWVGGVTDTAGGSTNDRGLFFDGNILLQGGDDIGVGDSLTVGSGVDFDVRFSQFGNRYILPVDVDSSNANDLVVVVDGSVLSLGGDIVREGTTVPIPVGGDGGERWDEIDFVAINEAGEVFLTGETDGTTNSNEFVLAGGSIVLREGDLVGGLPSTGGIAGVTSGIEGGDMNEQGDWSVIWDVDDPVLGNAEVLILGGELIAKEGDAVDWDNDGIVDDNAVIDSFTGISSLTIGDRNADGGISVFFTADVDVDGVTLEGGFCYSTDGSCPVVPEPATEVLLAGMAIMGLFKLRR